MFPALYEVSLLDGGLMVRVSKAGLPSPGCSLSCGAAALAVWRLGNIESRWHSGGRAGTPE
jgi:hypothetical protein